MVSGYSAQVGWVLCQIASSIVASVFEPEFRSLPIDSCRSDWIDSEGENWVVEVSLYAPGHLSGAEEEAGLTTTNNNTRTQEMIEPAMILCLKRPPLVLIAPRASPRDSI